MAKGPEIPKTDSAEIEILIERLKQNKLEQRDVELIERLLRTVMALGIVALALRSPRWIVAPVGMVFLLWLVAASAILAQTIRKFSRPSDNQEPHSDT